MANADDVYSGPFLTAEYVKSHGLVGHVLKVTFVEPQEIGREKKKTKLVLTLSGAEKPLALNKTNAVLLITAWSNDYDKWVGRTLKLKLGMAMNPDGMMVPSIQVDPQTEEGSSTPPAPTGVCEPPVPPRTAESLPYDPTNFVSVTFPRPTAKAGLEILEILEGGV